MKYNLISKNMSIRTYYFIDLRTNPSCSCWTAAGQTCPSTIAQEKASTPINSQGALESNCCAKAVPQLDCPKNWRVFPSLKYWTDNAPEGRFVQSWNPDPPVAWISNSQFSSANQLTCQACTWTTAARIKDNNFMVFACERCYVRRISKTILRRMRPQVPWRWRARVTLHWVDLERVSLVLYPEIQPKIKSRGGETRTSDMTSGYCSGAWRHSWILKRD